MDNLTEIGIIGVGNMGHHFARRFLNNGYKLVIYDKNQEALSYFENENAYIADSPKEVADRVEIVFVSLPTPAIVKQVAMGENGIIFGNKINTYVDLSTTGQKVGIEVAKGLEEKGIRTLDAPVSGGVQGAVKGTLAVMASGEKIVFEKISPMLNIIGKNVFYVGNKIGQAQIVKVANNLLSGAALAITSEAVVLGKKAEIDPEVLISIFNAGSGRNTATTDKFPKSILTGKFDYGFTTDLMYKDLKLCMELAEELDVPMWLGSGVTQLWKYAVTQGGGNRDFTTIVNYLEEMVGIAEDQPANT
ncbi:NAD(P)-dependent oxidoreductase [Virgibacillus byunsanensis]|uniref:NAD(P)-dependent oxidoreductase n=1 Tax=Virgibacillus byunsanensis TaxID=570945 RepID=A0ABW3LG73_9BACI